MNQRQERIKIKNEEKKALGAFGRQCEGRCSKYGMYSHKSTYPKCPENKKENKSEKEEKEETECKEK